MKNSNTELDLFKREIDLSRWLEAQGWQRDSKASCKSSAIMINGDEKLAISRKAGSEHFVYTNVHNKQDSGSIIDFVQRRIERNMGKVRQLLRPARKGDFKPLHDWKAPAYAVDKDQSAWVHAQPVTNFDYTRGRAIKDSTINQYPAAIKQNPKTLDLMFAHTGTAGFSGYEYKGPATPKARISAGGQKAFCPFMKDQAKVTRLVITENALDALSYAQKDGCREDTAYVSMAGNPSEQQLKSLTALCLKPQYQSVILAHDNDQGGHDQAGKCEDAIKDAGAQIEVKREIPDQGKDWNEQLQLERQQRLEEIQRQQELERAMREAQEQREREQDHGMEM